MVGYLVGKHSRGARHGNVGLDYARHEAVVEAGGGGLNPAQSVTADDLHPGHGHFWVAAENVAIKQFRRHAHLSGVTDFGPWHDRLNLADMPRFDRVTKNDAHQRLSILRSQKLSVQFFAREHQRRRPAVRAMVAVVGQMPQLNQRGHFASLVLGIADQ